MCLANHVFGDRAKQDSGYSATPVASHDHEIWGILGQTLKNNFDCMSLDHGDRVRNT